MTPVTADSFSFSCGVAFLEIGSFGEKLPTKMKCMIGNHEATRSTDFKWFFLVYWKKNVLLHVSYVKRLCNCSQTLYTTGDLWNTVCFNIDSSVHVTLFQRTWESSGWFLAKAIGLYVSNGKQWFTLPLLLMSHGCWACLRWARPAFLDISLLLLIVASWTACEDLTSHCWTFSI